ncbi:M15 family metallopeptidase [Pseudonocardia kunmingensis]|uniref:D-alanyl-D-alanine carboxypeptidase-like protein n=1 Tax=Pseudonocardia kunmingensis TaxID=630975 RepID=A0A543DIY7_9PSEU|nr:M15 family metallopeptidase [Pseudonocardia kunmingensis]TQM09292.1 D-alanyl-D-alanine carboxypeptidase-like protein [Pseudonocardia kunmingensis]
MNRTTWAPAGAAGPVAATRDDDPFGDRFPTQPIAFGPRRGGLALEDRRTWAPGAADRRTSTAYRRPPPSRHHPASTGGASPREPARRAARSPRLTILIAVAVVIAAMIGALGHRTWTSSFPSAAPDPGNGRPSAPSGPLGVRDGAVPEGLTVFDDDVPAVANLDAGLLRALRQAATDAADDRVELVVNSGWRSREYQEHLLDEAISKYGSEEEAARWVATADTSSHVSGDAVDVGPTAAAAWLSEHGAEYGLCQIYRNEPWHYELRPDAADRGCPRMYADPTQDPRTQK